MEKFFFQGEPSTSAEVKLENGNEEVPCKRQETLGWCFFHCLYERRNALLFGTCLLEAGSFMELVASLVLPRCSGRRWICVFFLL